MARRGGMGGIVLLLAGAWLIGQLVAEKDHPARIETVPPASSTTEQVSAADSERSHRPEFEEPSREAQERVKQTLQPRWVRGGKVAFRAGPATTFKILDRFNTGRKVMLLTEGGEWSKVRDELTLREGWVANRFLADQAPARKPAVEKRKPAPQPIIIPKVEISDAEIIDRIIAQSIANYSGNCPCPFNTDRAGRRCGKRSAYSRPGGASPICFIGDVTPDMIAAMRRR